MRLNIHLILAVALLTACSSLPADLDAGPSQYGSSQRPKSFSAGTYVSGIVGVTDVTALNLELDSDFGTTVDDNELTLPWIAASLQVPVVKKKVEVGYEAGFSLGWQSDRNAIVIDTGTVLITADNDLRLFDISGGLFVATTIFDRLRLYGGAGPLAQFGRVDLELGQDINGDGSVAESGFGVGYYARTGIDLALAGSTSVGIVVRWVDSKLDFGSRFEKLDIEALQYGIAVTTGF